MSKVLKPGKRPFGKRSDLPIDYLIRHTRMLNPPISREMLGPPNSVKVFGDYGPDTVILRRCECCECRRFFDNHGPSVLCPKCEEQLQMAMAMVDHLPAGNLPPMVSRTVGVTQVAEGIGVRPKVSKHDTGDPIFRG